MSDLIKTFEGHSSHVSCLSLLDDGTFLSGSDDSTVKLWDIKTGSLLKTFEGHSAWVYCLALLDDGTFLSGSDDSTIKLWDIKTGSVLKTFADHSAWVRCLSLLDDGTFLSGSYDSTIKLWSTPLSQAKAETKKRKMSLMAELVEFSYLPPSKGFKGGSALSVSGKRMEM